MHQNRALPFVSDFTGLNFIHPTPKNNLLGWGAYKGEGVYKIPAAWAPPWGLKIYTPPPPPLKNAFWPEMGGEGWERGGGV